MEKYLTYVINVVHISKAVWCCFSSVELTECKKVCSPDRPWGEQ